MCWKHCSTSHESGGTILADNAFLDLYRVRRSGRRAVLATVVFGTGPTYRRPGASAVIAEDGEVIGAVSGGCLDADIYETALRVLAGEAPRLLDYNTAGPEDLLWGTASGCGGHVQILVAPVADSFLSDVVSALEKGLSITIDTVVTPGPSLGARSLAAGPIPAGVFRHTVDPPVTLLVCGAGTDARPVAEYAAAAGFRVIVADHRPAWAKPEHFPAAAEVLICDCGALPTQIDLPPGSYAVLLTHNYEADLGHLKALLGRPLAYVGLLGSRERSARLTAQLLVDRPDLEAAVQTKLHAPVGLDIGADGPREIAIAIVAELIAHRAGRPGTSLRGGQP